VTTATATREAPAATRLADPALAVFGKVPGWTLCLLPGLLTVYFAFNSGGWGPEARALALLFLAVLLMGRVALVRQPFAGLTPPLLIAGAALALFGAWTWLSSGWSDAPFRATIEFQRVALYTVALVFFASFPRRPGRLGLMLRALALAIGAICLAALATRLYPDVYHVGGGLSAQRLAYPISYWNGLGLVAAVGVVLMLHLACDARGPLILRAMGAAGVPVAAATIYFSFSRGATAAVIVGIVAYLAVGRPRGAIAGLIATVPTTYVALQAAYAADLLGTENNTTAAAASQGHRVAGALLVSSIAAALCRVALAPVDARMRGAVLSAGARQSVATGAVILAVFGLGVAIAADAPGRLDRAWASFTRPEKGQDARTRFRDVSVGGRREHWDVALAYYRQDRLRGAGAGTFETQWLRSRPSDGAVTDAHSLYYEVLSELGLVGFLLIVVALAAILVGVVLRARGRGRAMYGAVFAVSLMWAAHAGVDWDWELAAVSFWLFALAGAALANTARPEYGGAGMRWPVRVAAGLLCLVLAIGAVRTVVATEALDRGISAFSGGDCGRARAQAATSLSALDSQPQAAAILGYCDADRARHRESIREMSAAASLDPDHWRYRYGLAVVRAVAGKDPRPDLRSARRLNPRAEAFTTGAAARLMRANSPTRWRRIAATAWRPVD
jgi:hypothetical protein